MCKWASFCHYRETWSIPQRVVGLDNVKVRAAAASGVVSAAIGDDGSLWVWGRSKRGQLGLGREITEATKPCRVEALAGHDVVKVLMLFLEKKLLLFPMTTEKESLFTIPCLSSLEWNLNQE